MAKCNDCKFSSSDTDSQCWKREVVNEFIGTWKYEFKSSKNSDGRCKDFKKAKFRFMSYILCIVF